MEAQKDFDYMPSRMDARRIHSSSVLYSRGIHASSSFVKSSIAFGTPMLDSGIESFNFSTHSSYKNPRSKRRNRSLSIASSPALVSIPLKQGTPVSSAAHLSASPSPVPSVAQIPRRSPTGLHNQSLKDERFQYRSTRAVQMAKAAQDSIDAELIYLHARIAEEKLILGMLEDEVESAVSQRVCASNQLESLLWTLPLDSVKLSANEELDGYMKPEKEHEGLGSVILESPSASSSVIFDHNFNQALEKVLKRDVFDDVSVFSDTPSLELPNCQPSLLPSPPLINMLPELK